MSAPTAIAELGTEKISKLLLKYAIPSIIAMTASVLYNLIDSIFIGHAVGPLAISAVALTLPLMNIAAAFGAMIGIGASSLISIKLGQKDMKSARSILGNAIVMNVILGISLSIICLTFLDPILYMFGASDQTIGYAREFMRIFLLGNVFTHLYMGLSNLLRATGFPRKSMAIMILSVFINCILAAVFIFVFRWGIAGAAWATVIAQFTAAILQFIHFMDKKHEVSFSRGIFVLKKRIISGILSIGLAPFFINICTSLVVIIINNALKNNGGDLYIGAYGIVNRVVLVFGFIVFGLNQGMQPIVGFNYGARKYTRVKQALWLVILAATCVTTVGFLVGQLLPHQVAMMFTTDPTLLATAERALRIVTFVFPIVGFQIVTASFFQSIDKAPKAIFLSLTRQLVFLVPLLLILPGIYGSDGVWMSMPIADTVSTILAVILLAYQFRKFNAQKGIKPADLPDLG